MINSRYQYDRYNQLVFESRDCFGTDASTTVYEYDNFGNITAARTYRGNGYEGVADVINRGPNGNTMSVDTYTYGNTEWRDLLTAFKGHEITYDEIGNPLSYYNGDEYEFTWENGRRLRRTQVNGENLLYEYNENGIRTEKRSVGKYTDSYRLDGSKVVELKRSYNGSVRTDRYVFYYDESGTPYAFDAYVNGADVKRYHYITSLQGDVLQLSDESNRIIACYSYDGWGKLFAVTDENGDEISDQSHIAYANPIRYRGYFYDNETKLYYCGSRYYDPQIRRFINADGYVSTGGGFISYNMFTYCNNNPVMYNDSFGSRPILSTSVQNETKAERSASFAYMKKMSTYIPPEEPVQQPEPEVIPAITAPVMPIEGGTLINDWPHYVGTEISHRGTDIEADEGTPVHSVCAGTVVDLSTKINYNAYETSHGMDTYGIYIKIRSEDDDVVMIYAHLSAVNVSVGQQVMPWDVIGLSGNTGHSKAPHLHFEVNDAYTGEILRPFDYLP